VPDAQVCLLQDGEFCSVGQTGADGYCELEVSAATAGLCRLTVTKHNCRPVLQDVAIAQAVQFVGYLSSSVDDDDQGASQGNGDARLNPGETIELTARLKNFGTQTAADVTAVLESEDPYLTLLQASSAYGSIPVGGDAAGDAPYVLRLSGACPHGHEIRLRLRVRSGANEWPSLFSLSAVSADLQATRVTLYNAGNDRLDPGETLAMSVELMNVGEADAEGVSGYLTSLSPWVYVLDSVGSYGNIPAEGLGENVANRYSVKASPETYEGHLAVFRLVTSFNGAAVDTTYTALTVGQCSSDDPVGPDAYGYVAFDNTDTGYSEAPTYNWIGIAPGEGGDGTQIPLGDYGEYQDESLGLDLPFTFRFYGQDFDRATVCTNGWLAMGDTYLTNYRNWTIPGAGAPQNMIAAFWDDLYEVSSVGGHVYQKYDAANHRWIVEWYSMRNAVGYSNYETFEVILFDPAYYPTATGDGIILLQYSTTTNVDNIDGYATVGIENGDHTDGLLYTFFNRYPTGAATLSSGRAIRILPAAANPAGVRASASAPVFSLESVGPNPFLGRTILTYSLEAAGPARLSIFDVAGRSVRRLLEGEQPAGTGVLSWDGRDEAGRPVPSGIYFCRLVAGERERVRRLIKVE